MLIELNYRWPFLGLISDHRIALWIVGFFTWKLELFMEREVTMVETDGSLLLGFIEQVWMPFVLFLCR